MSYGMTLPHASFKAIYGSDLRFCEGCARKEAFHFGLLRADAMSAGESAESSFGTLDARPIAQPKCTAMLPDQLHRVLSLSLAILAIDS
jgi:hypothetical protein